MGWDASVSFGSDASIDEFVPMGAAAWLRLGAAGSILRKGEPLQVAGAGRSLGLFVGVAESGHLEFRQGFSITSGFWASPNDSLAPDVEHAIAVNYSNASTGNDPDMYINGSLQAELETSVPTGSAGSDAGFNLQTPSEVVAFVLWTGTTLTAAAVNRHRWWGMAPGGPSTIEVCQPMWTTDLTNKGTAVAPGSTAGNFVSLPRVERCWGSLMGVGR